ncbi:MAG TPA: anthranilate synthase component 1 [Arsenophonus apicola]|uniref:anthranilate synthase component 1 n=1 Tax=Arsenophonus apicola TaxID=2879119 RepID=UPI001CDBF9B5|nr:anthranilate synthase component 1 [Arsenophonus apicola]UBX30458.1 anthranilate synthase component 1 [Arsenophonus apicola]
MANTTVNQTTFCILQNEINYHPEPCLLFQHLCNNDSDTLLLESAAVDSKQNQQSILIVNSALRITANQQQVSFAALSPNGNALLSHIYLALPSELEKIESDGQLVVNYPTIDPHLDEDSRLKATSSFDALRLIHHLAKHDTIDADKILLAGLFSYDLVAYFENLPPVAKSNRCPDYCIYLAEHYVVIEHQKQSAKLISCQFSAKQSIAKTILNRHQAIITATQQPLLPLPTGAEISTPLVVNKNDSEYCAMVEKLKKYIYQGDIFQVVPSRKFMLPCTAPLSAYQRLTRQNPSPYMFYMQDQEFTLFGASPESALKYDAKSRQIEIYPIAGTRPRGRTVLGEIDADLDSKIELALRTDQKELAEHIMLVDLARNDLARICQPGSRYVANLTSVDRYSHVMHLVSRVVGKLRTDLDVLHAYQACMNMGTLTGAPKIKAMTLIANYEKENRGSYGGAIGYFKGNGDFDSCIVIRAAYIEDNIASVQVGAGVVLDSDPQSETDETRNKAQAVINAIMQSHQSLEVC